MDLMSASGKPQNAVHLRHKLDGELKYLLEKSTLNDEPGFWTTTY